MVRNRRLGELELSLDIAGTEPLALSYGTGAFLLQDAQNREPGGISYGFESGYELAVVGGRHIDKYLCSPETRQG